MAASPSSPTSPKVPAAVSAGDLMARSGCELQEEELEITAGNKQDNGELHVWRVQRGLVKKGGPSLLQAVLLMPVAQVG